MNKKNNFETVRQKRLAKRYPVLKEIPADQREKLVRMAMLHPIFLLVMISILFLLPLYVSFIFSLLNLQNEPTPLLFIAKVAGTILLPVCILLPLLSKFIMPYCLKRAMEKQNNKKS